MLPPPPGWRAHRLTGDTMGTTWMLRAHAPAGLAPDALRAAVQAELAQCIALFSPWVQDSEIARVNADPAPEVELSPVFAAFLADLLIVARATGGAYDPGLGALVDLWGFGPPGPQAGLPPAAALAAARAVSGWRWMRLDGARLTRPPGLRLDFGGSAKGWAVDRVSAALTAAGAGFHLIEIGGECFGRGLKPDMHPWWVGLDGAAGAASPWRVALNGWGIATSGDGLRCFWQAGRRYGHTLDPATGAPLADGPASVTVIADTVWRADALATALMVLPAAARDLLAAEQGIAALVQGWDGSWAASPAWARMMDDDDQP